MESFVRICGLLWADILVAYALFVMQHYLTDVWKLSFTHAAAILNIWGGISMVLPVFFQFLVDAILGNFMMLVLSSIAYSAGIGFVTMSTPPVLADSTGTCKQYKPECIGHTQKILFYTGMALIAVGVAGNLVSVKPFLEEQKQQSNANAAHDDNEAVKDCFRIPGAIILALVPVIGAIALPYIKPWTLRFGIPAICTVIATLFFLTGWCMWPYHTVEPEGSPVTNVCRVFVAAASKISQPFPLDAEKYYKENANELQAFTNTRCLRRLQKAAIILPDVKIDEQRQNRWTLCSVAEVEDAKVAIRMVPMWMTFIICGIVSSIGNTYFVEQSNKLNRNMGKWKVPPQILLLVFGWAKDSFANIAKRFLDQRSEKCAPALGIAVAMISSILCCITAARMEIKRLKVVRRHGLLDKPDEDIPMSIFWLLFQFILLAGLDSFLEKSVVAFYNDQSPESMKKESTKIYINYFTRAVSGLGFMFSVLSVYVVGKISEKGGKTNWFQYTLNNSRLDRYYWVLAALSSVNLVVFILVASCYRYKNREESVEDADATGGDELYSDGNNDCKCCCC